MPLSSAEHDLGRPPGRRAPGAERASTGRHTGRYRRPRDEHLAYLLGDGERPLGVFTGGSLIVGSAARTDLLGADRALELAHAAHRSPRPRDDFVRNLRAPMSEPSTWSWSRRPRRTMGSEDRAGGIDPAVIDGDLVPDLGQEVLGGDVLRAVRQGERPDVARRDDRFLPGRKTRGGWFASPGCDDNQVNEDALEGGCGSSPATGSRPGRFGYN